MKLRIRKRHNSRIQCSVVLVAAGSSSRIGLDKMMLKVGDLPVIVHSIKAFENINEVTEIIVVTRDELIPEIAGFCKAFDLKKVKKIVRGGASRMESARIGTLEIDQTSTLIAIHDAARPFVSETVIRAVIEKASQTGAAAPAIPVKDTIKVANKGLVEQTPDRSTMFAVQTPQVFDASLICAALQKALDDGAEITDDCSAVERLGMKVTLTQGDERNIKLTTPIDVFLADIMLREG